MQLSSVYLYEKIKEKYEITERGTLSGSDGYAARDVRGGFQPAEIAGRRNVNPDGQCGRAGRNMACVLPVQ